MNQCFTYSISSSFSLYADIHTFSAKEKDTETGLSYFGSRYYSSDLSIWLSVDPMSDKYPHQSNYVYCSNNPIKVIDPNGEDEYEFDKQGNLMNKITNENEDKVHILDDNGNRVASSRSFAAGTICETDYNSQTSDVTIYEIENGEVADELHQFLSKNTSVEWGVVNAEENGECYNFIGTNNNEKCSSVGGKILNEGLLIDRVAHNHPGGNNTVSEEDHYGAIQYEQNNPNVQLFNYTNSNGYTRYSSGSEYLDNARVYQRPSLPAIEIIWPQKK